MKKIDIETDYDKLSNNSKKYIKKMIEFYMAIKNSSILYVPYIDRGKSFYKDITKKDKICCSALMAAYYDGSNIKSITELYDDLNEKKFCDFFKILESDIKEIPEDKIKEIYDNELKDFFISCINNNDSIVQNIVGNEINAANLLSAMINDTRATSFGPLLYYIGVRDTYCVFDCALFKDITSYVEANANKDLNYEDKKFSDVEALNGASIDYDLQELKKIETEITNLIERGDWLDKIISNSKSIIEKLTKKFIGQEKLAKDLFNNIITNLIQSSINGISPNFRSVVFVDGPSGTGKTAIINSLTKELKFPYSCTSVRNYSSTGYVGGDLTDILVDLLSQAKGDLQLAEHGIVVLDEFDKLGSTNLEMNSAIQHDLLTFIGGGDYEIIKRDPEQGNSKFSDLFAEHVTFNTSKLTFVLLGALTKTHENKQMRDSTIGFKSDGTNEMKQEYSLTPQDLIDAGLEKELVGRINTFLHSNDYSVDDLENILRKSTISPLNDLIVFGNHMNKKIIIEEDAYHSIALAAYSINTGARSLTTVIMSIRNAYLETILSGEETEIIITSSDVERIMNETTNRKARK